MASLVANYSSSDDSDADSEGTEAVQSASTLTETVPGAVTEAVTETVTEAVTEAGGRNYLMTQAEDDSTDDDDKDPCSGSATSKSETERLPNPLIGIKLPKPALGKKKHGKKPKSKSSDFVERKLAENSVFSNQYEKAAHAKQSILEKHVKMTEKIINSDRRVCKKFKRGQCRFGKNCKYSHDLDSLSLPNEQQQDTGSESGGQHQQQKPWQQQPSSTSQQVPRQQGFMGTVQSLRSGTPSYSPHQMAKFRQQQQHMQRALEDDNDDNYMAGDKRKKRVGVGQTLVPPKRAMAALDRQRETERPWTVSQK